MARSKYGTPVVVLFSCEIERTSGNMGTGLAIVCAVKGYKFVAVMSEGNSVERRRRSNSIGYGHETHKEMLSL